MGTVKSGTRPPWVGLGAAVWVQIAAGNGYNFPLYSPSLKAVLGYSQQQLTILGVANDIGENFGILPGVFCNKLPPWILLLIGAFACFLGYGVLWLAVSGTVTLPYWLLWIALCVATNSSAWLGTGVLVTNMKNFPLNRGTISGILKGYAGLSAAVYTGIFTGLLHNSPARLLMFLTLGIPAVSLMMMFFVRPCTPATEEDSSEHSHFLYVQIASVLLGVFLLTTTILSDTLSLSATISYTFFGIMVLLLLAPLVIPLKMTLYPTQQRKRIGATDASSSAEQLFPGDEEDKTEPLLPQSSSTTNLGSFQEVDDDDSDVNILLAEGEGAVVPTKKKKKRRPKRGEDFSFSQAFVKADFWLLFLVYFLGVGSAVTVLNNLAQIGIAAGNDDTTLLLCLLSFCSFLGRLAGGTVSEYYVRSKMLPRPIWIAFTQLLMILVYILFASALGGTLYVSTALIGVCYGVQIAVMVPVASELFGLKHFGKICSFMSLGNPLGALLFSGVLAGYVYDRESERQRPGGGSCYGPDCFRLTFLVLAAVCGLGSLLSVVLTVRVRPVYHMLYASGSFRQPPSSR